MKESKPTGIPEHEKSPGIGVVGGMESDSCDHGRWNFSAPRDEENDDTDERYADEEGPAPLDKLFR
jgi:hypothetical protein